MWLCNHVSMPPYEYALISYCHTWVQLGNFSSAWNLAILQVGPQSGMIMYLDMISPWSSDDKPLLLWPEGLLKFCKQQPFGVWKLLGAVARMTERCLKVVCKISARCLYYVGKVSLSCLKVSGKFLIVSRMLPHSGPTWVEILLVLIIKVGLWNGLIRVRSSQDRTIKSSQDSSSQVRTYLYTYILSTFHTFILAY